MSYSALPTRTTSDPNSAADINQLQSNITYLKDTVITTSTKTADYTITDSDGIALMYINPTTGNVTITLPTLADNQDRQIKFIVSDLGGKVTIDPEGAETVAGYSSLIMQSKNDNLHIVAEAGEWQIISYNAKYDTGWINTSDWTNRHLGTSAFDVDNRSASNFTVGELITESTSGNTGIVQSDDGTTIYVKNVTGTGIWTNNETVTGATSGETALVNEASGSNKNQDSSILHDLSLDFDDYLNTKMFLSTDGTMANAWEQSIYPSGDSSAYGATIHYVDTNNVKMQTGNNGMTYAKDDGTVPGFSSSDWYYKIIIEVKI
jgi:hypothetical protein